MSPAISTAAARFRPPIGLRHAHVQSILGASRLRAWALRLRAQYFVKNESATVLHCDAGVRLMAKVNIPPEPATAVVVVLHGWEGSADATYMLSLGHQLLERGCITVRINFRDHGGTHALNEGLFHSCRIDEVVSAVAAVSRLYPSLPLHVAGFSLGGNFALRVAAHARSPEIRRVLAVCPVLHPPSTMRALEDGLWLYKFYFLRRWRRSLRTKAETFPELYQFVDLRSLPTLTATTDYFVCNYTEFENLEDYLHGYSIVDGRLDTLSAPSVCLLTRDDPVIPVADAHRLGTNPALHVEVLPYGGHCALLEDYRLRSWLNSAIDQLLLD
jgi:predicted alpha/beta-fold hydrolase